MKNTIADIQKKYSGQIDYLDLELIIAHSIKKSREFVLSHPEHMVPKLKIVNCELKIARRMRDEPLAYILGSREFFGLPFLVSPATLIPRPETELLVEMALHDIQSTIQDTIKNEVALTLIDIGTGSGNIIISMAKSMDNFKFQTLPTGRQVSNFKFIGVDISSEALKIAKKNARVNDVAKKIKFLRGNLLEPIMEDTRYKIQDTNYTILANLPYLSNEIYRATRPTVKKFEPRSALFSPKEGLDHYEKLLQQLKQLQTTCLPDRRVNYLPDKQAGKLRTTLYIEISPEQKAKLSSIIKKYFPNAIIEFHKDLAQKWRICKISI